jgi:hypothetical protein
VSPLSPALRPDCPRNTGANAATTREGLRLWNHSASLHYGQVACVAPKQPSQHRRHASESLRSNIANATQRRLASGPVGAKIPGVSNTVRESPKALTAPPDDTILANKAESPAMVAGRPTDGKAGKKANAANGNNTIMNISRILLLAGIVLIQVSGANAQFGNLGNLINKNLNSLNTNNTTNGTAPTTPAVQNDQQATPPATVPATQNDQSQTPTKPSATSNVDVPPQNGKAYKTLNFGDNAEIVENKLAEIIDAKPMDPNNPFHHDPGSGSIDPNRAYDDGRFGETFSRSLFDTDAEYEPNKFNYQHGEFPDNFKPLMDYFKEQVGITVLNGGNNAFSLNCFLLNRKPQGHAELTIVEVSYLTFDLNKLLDGFRQNYPNARERRRPYRIESTMYPGVFLEFERTLFSDINPERRATLSIPTDKFTFTFTELSKLSQDQLAVWDRLMTQDGKTSQRNEYVESVKTSLLGLVKDIESGKGRNLGNYSDPNAMALDALTYQGWYEANREYEPIIYGRPNAIFASKQILGYYMNVYMKSIQDEAQKQSSQLKKQSDAANGF